MCQYCSTKIKLLSEHWKLFIGVMRRQLCCSDCRMKKWQRRRMMLTTRLTLASARLRLQHLHLPFLRGCGSFNYGERDVEQRKRLGIDSTTVQFNTRSPKEQQRRRCLGRGKEEQSGEWAPNDFSNDQRSSARDRAPQNHNFEGTICPRRASLCSWKSSSAGGIQTTISS